MKRALLLFVLAVTLDAQFTPGAPGPSTSFPANLYSQGSALGVNRAPFSVPATAVQFSVGTGTQPQFTPGSVVTFSGGGTGTIIEARADFLPLPGNLMLLTAASGSISGTFIGNAGTALCTVISAAVITLTDGLDVQGAVNSSVATLYFKGAPFLTAFEPNFSGNRGRNVFVGFGAGNATMGGAGQFDGALNTAVGSMVLGNNTTGAYNVAIGPNALLHNTTGLANTSLGTDSLEANVSANGNTAVGRSALIASTGPGNTAVGTLQGFSITTGSFNTLLGFYGGGTGPGTITTGSNNIELQTGSHLNGPGIITGNGNVVIGDPSGLAPDAQNTVTIADGLGNTKMSFDTAGHPRLPGALDPPASSSAAGSPGELRYGAGFIYICVATNTWQRAALVAF